MKKRGDINRKTTAAILKTLTDSGEPLHVREVIKRSGLCNETVVRVLKTLAEKGWLECIKHKNRKYYCLKHNLPLLQKLKIFSLMKDNSAEEGRKERTSIFEGWMGFFAALSRYFSDFLKSVEKIREVEENQARNLKVIGEINDDFKAISEKIDYMISFYERNREKVDFIRKELLAENIDIYEADVLSVMKLISWFKRIEEGYSELRMRGGLRPLEALEWAKEYKWIKIRKELKVNPMGEWDREVRRLFEHPPEVLRDAYGWRLTYREILGLND